MLKFGETHTLHHYYQTASKQRQDDSRSEFDRVREAFPACLVACKYGDVVEYWDPSSATWEELSVRQFRHKQFDIEERVGFEVMWLEENYLASVKSLNQPDAL